MFVKYLFLSVFLAVGLTTAAGTPELTPEQQLKIGADGAFVNTSGKPELFLGAQIGGTRCIVSVIRDSAKSPAPRQYDYMYRQIPNHENMKQVGFNSLCINVGVFWLRVFSPEYRGYEKRLEWETYLKEVLAAPKVLRYYRAVWLEKTQEMFRNLRLPLYIETHDLAYISRNPEWLEKYAGKDLLSDYKNKSAFSLPFHLGKPEARELVYKMWRHAAKSMKFENAKVYSFELFNEPKYGDSTPFNRRLFVEELKKQYPSVDAVNREWGTRYSSFAEIETLPLSKEHPAFHVAFGKFQQNQIVELCREGDRQIKAIMPDTGTTVQSLGHEAYRQSWHNFPWHELSKTSNVINTGTGNHTYAFFAGLSDAKTPFAKTPNVTTNIRENLTRMKFMLALAGKSKPMLNGECYTSNTKTALHAIIWNEVMRGQNAVYLFAWGGIAGTKERAMIAPYEMLNTYYFPYSAFEAIPQARNEIAAVADLVLPRSNRVKADCAVLYSLPSIRYDGACGTEFTAGMTTAAMALQFSSYAYDMILEEQLSEQLKNYKVLFASGVRNTFKDTMAQLEAFVKNGGTLVLGAPYPAMNEYGKTIPNFLDSKPEKYGKGRIVYLPEGIRDYELAEKLETLLPVKPMANVRKAGTMEKMANVEVQKCAKDGLTLFYLNNLDGFPKHIAFSAPEFSNAVVIDPFGKRTYEVKNGTVSLALPIVGRTILIAGSKTKVAGRFGAFSAFSAEETQKEYDSLCRAASRKKENSRPGATVNLAKFANYGFDNQQKWPVDTAWFDKKGRDLKGVPWHENVFGKTAFELIRMDFNDNRTCIALKSRNLPDAPEEVTGIPVDAKIGSLSLLHAVTHGTPGETAFRCRVRYADGSSTEIPFVVGKNTGDWRLAENPENMKKLIAWKNGDDLGFFQTEWRNPTPEKLVTSLDFISGNGNSTPIVVAVSTHPAPKQRVELPGWTFSGAPIKNGVIELNGMRNAGFTAPQGKGLTIPKEKLESAEIVFELNNRTTDGNRVKLVGAVIYAAGYRGQKPCTGGASAATDSWMYTRSHNPDDDPATWQKMRIPLAVSMRDNNGKIFETLTELTIRAHQKDCQVLVRDFHLEW